MESKGESDHLLESQENLEILETLEIPTCEKTPFRRNDPCAAPDNCIPITGGSRIAMTPLQIEGWPFRREPCIPSRLKVEQVSKQAAASPKRTLQNKEMGADVKPQQQIHSGPWRLKVPLGALQPSPGQRTLKTRRELPQQNDRFFTRVANPLTPYNGQNPQNREKRVSFWYPVMGISGLKALFSGAGNGSFFDLDTLFSWFLGILTRCRISADSQL